MKNNHTFCTKALLAVNMLFFSVAMLKADEPQENTKLNLLLAEANSQAAECIKQLKCNTIDHTREEIYQLYCKLAEARFNASECIKQLGCNTKCETSSNYPELCKLKCTAKHLKRTAEFKVRQFLNR